MSVYVYCVSDRAGGPDPQVVGIQNQLARSIQVGDLRVVVSDFSGTSLKPTKDNVYEHERVIETFMEDGTPLPFRFGCVLAEPKLEEFVRANADILRKDLENVRDCVEMGLKIIVPPEPSSPESTTASQLPGTAFLMAKRRNQGLVQKTARWVDDAVEDFRRQTVASLLAAKDKPMVRIAHLVPRCHLNEYKLRIDGLIQTNTDSAFLRSGPWPPYSFVTAPRLG